METFTASMTHVFPAKQQDINQLAEMKYNSPNVSIRLATDSDSHSIIAIIDSVLNEWDDAVCLEGSEADLLTIQNSYHDVGGVFVVMEIDGNVAGTHAVLPIDVATGLCTFKRLYLRKDLRGTSAGKDLMQWNIDWAKAHGFKKIEFWSDTRFDRAHKFFGKFGFDKGEQTREMNDSHETYWEYYFSKLI